MESTLSKLKVTSWNANCITNKKEELTIFLKEHDVDIMLLCETWLRAGDILKIANYVVYRSDRSNQPGGGTAVVVKKDLKHCVLNPITNIAIENCRIRLEDGSLVIAAYKPPNSKLKSEDLKILFDHDHSVLLMGDLNSKNSSWGCNSTNQAGKTLKEYIDGNDVLLHVPNSSTYFGHSCRPDILDIAMTKNVTVNSTIEVIADLSSDHNPILFNILTENTRLGRKEKRKTNWIAYHYFLKLNSTELKTMNNIEDIDVEVETLTSELTTAREQCSRTVASKTLFDLPNDIKEMLRVKRKAQRIYQRTLAPSDKLLATRLTNQLRRKLRDFKNEKWEETMSKFNDDHTGVWKFIRKLGKQEKQIPPINGSHGVAYSDEEKAEAFADSIEHQCSVEDDSDDEVDENSFSKFKKGKRQLEQLQTGTTKFPVNLQEVTDLIKACKNGKAPGCDGITAQMLRYLPKKNKVRLLNIINSCLRHCYFPAAWKMAVIKTIPKPKKDLRWPENHRPISLLPIPAKIFERVILKRLNAEIEQLIPNEQFGFRQTLSSTLQCLRLGEIIGQGFDQKETTCAVFLDVAKAFDRVWHDALIHKMQSNKIDLHLIKIIQSFLENRRFVVKHNEAFSSERRMEAGVVQGSVLGPILYTIYTCDIPKTPGSELALYADDTAILVRDKNAKFAAIRLQHALTSVIKWCRCWKIKINEDKCQAICFSRSRTLPNKLELNDLEIPWSDEIKYLGIVFDKKFTFKKHIELTKTRSTIIIQKLYGLFKSKNLDLKRKLQVYTTIIRPMITYGIAVWGISAKSNMSNIQIIQNKILRIICDAPWFISNRSIRRDLQIPTITNFVRDEVKTTISQAKEHWNTKLQDAFKPPPPATGSKRPSTSRMATT